MHRFTRSFGVLTLVSTSLAAAAGPALADSTVGWIEIKGALQEKPSPLAWLAGDAQPTLQDMVDALHAAADRDDLDAVFLRLREPKLTTTHVEELGGALKAIRERGKTVHLFTEIYGPAELLLGSFVDDVILQQGGAVSMPGIHVEEMFLADALGSLGAKMDYIQVGKYKGAEEQLGRNAPSKAWDENITQLIDSLYETMRAHLKEGRGLTDAELDKAMETAWFSSGEAAISVGLIDAEVDRLEINEHLANHHRDKISYQTNLAPSSSGGMNKDMMANPFAIFQILSKEPENRPTRATIAVLDIDGAIVDGESKPASFLGGGTVGSLTIREALKKIGDESLIRGVVVRINSPGGSAIASESIWLGLKQVAEKKPVWVSVGGMAASGGYYIAVAGERIYVNPSSIIGSIGVVGGKPVLGGTYDKLNINVVSRDRGPAASLMSSVEPWTEHQRALVRERMTETYDLFVERVKAGRPDIDIAKTAEGRLFAGQKAIDLNMADRIGGLDVAIADLAATLSMQEGRYDVMHYPGPKSIEELLQEMLGGFGMHAPSAQHTGLLVNAAIDALQEIVGPRAWPVVRDSLNAMWQMRREPVLLTSPRVLIFR